MVGPRISSLFSCNTSCMEHPSIYTHLTSPPIHCAHATILHTTVLLFITTGEMQHAMSYINDFSKFLEVAPIPYTQVLMLSHYKQRLLDHNQVDPQLTVGVKAFLFGPLIDARVNTCIIHKDLIHLPLTTSFPLPLIPLINHAHNMYCIHA